VTAPGRATAILILAATEAPRGAEDTALLGLPLLRRTALAAARAGFDAVYVLADEDAELRRLLLGTIATALPPGAPAPTLPPGRVVLLPRNVVATPGWLRSLRQAPVKEGRLCRLGAGAIVDTPDPSPLAAALAGRIDVADVLDAWASALPPRAAAEGVAPPVLLRSREGLDAAERWLLKDLVKTEDGLLTRLISRKISLAVTRRLARTTITPNAMTFLCLALGLAAAWCFGSSTAAGQLAGGVLFLTHSILDGCDGELARLKFKESRIGGLFDFWADNVVHVAVFSAFAHAWSAAVDDDWPLLLGGVAVAGTILSATLVWVHAMRPRSDDGPLLKTLSPSRRSRLTAILDEVARRDFIYLVMVLAVFGKAYWFLAAAAVGIPTFLLVLAVLMLGGSRRPVRVESVAYR